MSASTPGRTSTASASRSKRASRSSRPALPLVTERLVLRDFVTDDWRWTNTYEANPDVVRYQSHGVLDEAGSRARVERSIACAAARPRRVWDLAITLKDDGRPIGRAGLGRQPKSKEAALWYVLHPAWHGRGYVTEACRALLAMAFGPLGLHRVYGDVDPRNEPSARVLERLGMRREAHHVENAWIKDEWCDSVIYAVLDREWALLDREWPAASKLR